jgi:hypothetical protein
MGNIFTAVKETGKPVYIWPIKSFYHASSPEDYERGKYTLWNPSQYEDAFRYPAKEPAKDF